MANLLRSPCSINPALNEGAAGFARRGLWELYFYVLPNVVAWRGGERRLVVLRRDE
jgi:hypothetical protein